MFENEKQEPPLSHFDDLLCGGTAMRITTTPRNQGTCCQGEERRAKLKPGEEGRGEEEKNAKSKSNVRDDDSSVGVEVEVKLISQNKTKDSPVIHA